MHLEIGLGSGTLPDGRSYYDSRIFGKFKRDRKVMGLGIWFGHPVRLFYGIREGTNYGVPR